MSVSIMEIGRSTNGSRLPLDSYVEPYGETSNHLALPFNVLWEQARSGITKFVHFSYKNLHQILGQADMEIVPQNNDILPASIPRSSMSLNSRIISGSFGRGRKIQFPNSVEISLKHLQEVDPSRPAHSVCVVWDPEQTAWSNLGCSLASSNKTHSVCRCSRLGSTSLITAPNADGPSAPTTLPVMTLQIVTYIVAAISVLCVLLILVKVSSHTSMTGMHTPPSSISPSVCIVSFAVPCQHPEACAAGSVPKPWGEARLQPQAKTLHSGQECPYHTSGTHFTTLSCSLTSLNQFANFKKITMSSTN